MQINIEYHPEQEAAVSNNNDFLNQSPLSLLCCIILTIWLDFRYSRSLVHVIMFRQLSKSMVPNLHSSLASFAYLQTLLFHNCCCCNYFPLCSCDAYPAGLALKLLILLCWWLCFFFHFQGRCSCSPLSVFSFFAQNCLNRLDNPRGRQRETEVSIGFNPHKNALQ